MFSTPSVRVANQENADPVMRKAQIQSTRKPHLHSARKAFQDRSVNTKVDQLLRNSTITKLNLHSVLKSPEVKPKEEEPPCWMTSMSFNPPPNEMNMIEYSSILFKSNLLSTLISPLPTPISMFESDFELMSLPPASPFLYDTMQEINQPEHILNNDFNVGLDIFLEKPHANFDY